MRRPLIPRADARSCVRCTLALFTVPAKQPNWRENEYASAVLRGTTGGAIHLSPQAFPQSGISCDTDQGGKTQVLIRQLHEFDPPLAALQLVAEAR